MGENCPANFVLDQTSSVCECPEGRVRFNSEGCIVWDDPTYLYSNLSECIGDASILVKFDGEFRQMVTIDDLSFERIDMFGAEPNYAGGWIPSGGGDYLKLTREDQPDSIIWQMPMDAQYYNQNLISDDEERGIFLNWSGIKISDSLYVGTVKLGHYDNTFPWSVIDVFSTCPDTLKYVEL